MPDLIRHPPSSSTGIEKKVDPGSGPGCRFCFGRTKSGETTPAGLASPGSAQADHAPDLWLATIVIPDLIRHPPYAVGREVKEVGPGLSPG